jgi:hypothetical protein
MIIRCNCANFDDNRWLSLSSWHHIASQDLAKLIPALGTWRAGPYLCKVHLVLICTEVDFSDFMQVASLKPAQWSSEAEDPAGRQERLAAAWLGSRT